MKQHRFIFRNVISMICQKECIILKVAREIAPEKNADPGFKRAVRE